MLTQAPSGEGRLVVLARRGPLPEGFGEVAHGARRGRTRCAPWLNRKESRLTLPPPNRDLLVDRFSQTGLVNVSQPLTHLGNAAGNDVLPGVPCV